VSEEAKALVVLDFFEEMMGTVPVSSNSINLDALDLLSIQQGGLVDRFIEEEVWNMIRSLPPDKAPGPDDFSTRFFQATWLVIRLELMAAFDTF
jgi:hypothetical protein